MEELTSSSSSSSVTPEIAVAIAEAVQALPQAHRSVPRKGESFETPKQALLRLQNWAFTQGFAVVTESRTRDRVRFHCIHHHKKTRNTRKTKLEDRERVQTKTKAKGCLWSIYISIRKETGQNWILGWTHNKHNHSLTPDPFTYDEHKEKRKGYSLAIQRASIHRGTASFATSARLLRKEGLLGLTRKDFYNLNQRERQGGKLTKEEEILVLIEHLEDHKFHVQCRWEYALDDKGKTTGKRVIKDLFFINKAQIQLGRRFVSGWMYETDATFNTNELRLPLSSMVGITNTGNTFPLAYCYITSESARSFEFVAHQLTKYVFYNCCEAAVIVADFTKGLGAALTSKAV